MSGIGIVVGSVTRSTVVDVLEVRSFTLTSNVGQCASVESTLEITRLDGLRTSSLGGFQQSTKGGSVVRVETVDTRLRV